MMNNLKLGIRVWSYGYGIRMSLIQGAIFLLMGVLLFASDAASPVSAYNGGIPADFMFMCTGMLPAQVLYSLSAVNIVQTSPMKKKLQTAVPAAATWACMTVLYLIIALARGIMVLNCPEKLPEVCNGLIVLGAAMILLMFYTGVVYKYFLSTILFLILFFYIAVYYGSRFISQGNILLQNRNMSSFVLAAVIGLACIAVGGIGEYLLSLLVYKVPMSKMALGASLRKEL